MKTIRDQNAPDTYFELIKKFPLKSIADEKHFSQAEKMIEKLLADELDDGAQDYLDALTDLVDVYEEEHHDIGEATTGQMITLFLRDRKISQNTLATGADIPKSTVSDLINGRRSITIETAKKLGLYFGVDPSLFIEWNN